MTRTLDVSWTGGAVTAKLAEAGSHVGVLLAHGAGAGQDHAFMAAMRDGLVGAGVTTMTFDYAYTHAGRRSPDRMPKLLDVHEAAYRVLAERVEAVLLAGKSMGGRVGSHLAGGVDGEPGRTGEELAGLVYLGYPLVPMGRGEPRATDHLGRIGVPQLFVAGTRDRLSPPPLIAELVATLPNASLHVIDDADHGFHVPKRSGRTDADVLAELVELVVAAADTPSQASGGT